MKKKSKSAKKTKAKKPKRLLRIGLTGGIGMGKSTAASILRGFGLPIYEADKAVHDLLKKGGKGVKAVAKLFPDTFARGGIDRKLLGPMVFADPAGLKKLEAVLHPLVHEVEEKFLKKASRTKAAAAILEIPLLYETGADKRCDYVLCVTAPEAVRKERVMKRPGMTAAKLLAIRNRQMPEIEKCRRADYVIDTGTSRADTARQLRRALAFMLLG